jgi:hypothetical protein
VPVQDGDGVLLVMGTVGFARGMVQTPVNRWICTKCRKPVHYLNKRQRREWLAKQANPGLGLKVECRGWLPFRRECAGHLVPAEAVAL